MPHGDHVFVVGIVASDEVEREHRVDALREELMQWEFVTDVMDFDDRKGYDSDNYRSDDAKS